MRTLLAGAVLFFTLARCGNGNPEPACSTLGWNDCLNRRDCVTDQCPNCGGVDLTFLDCHDKGTLPHSCPALQCPPMGCDDVTSCGYFQVCAEREPSFSGSCDACAVSSCGADAECDGGTLCDDTPCHCGKRCIAPCKVASCPSGTFCSTNGHCEAAACGGDAGCPAGLGCDGGTCARPGCVANAECGTGGWCVHGSCYPTPGYCIAGSL